MTPRVTAIIGAQYGSEGKGVIVNHIADRYDAHVRVGGPNAGHSFTHLGKVWKMQTIPCGWTNPDASLFIGPGGMVNPRILLEELAMLPPESNIYSRLVIHKNAGVLDDTKHHAAEGGITGELHARIGSTGEGVGASRIAKMQRNPREYQLFGDVAESNRLADLVVSGEEYYNLLRKRSSILLEGTQGVGLSLHHGPWPYVTSADTGAAQMCADAGIPPMWLIDIIAVARTFPIRVAGNSGPLARELDWKEMSHRVGKPVEERTTVTKLVRRIGSWDWSLLDRTYNTNHPTRWALTFADYISNLDEGKTDYYRLSPTTKDLIHQIESRYHAPVSFVGTGGDGWKVAEA